MVIATFVMRDHLCQEQLAGVDALCVLQGRHVLLGQ